MNRLATAMGLSMGLYAPFYANSAPMFPFLSHGFIFRLASKPRKAYGNQAFSAGRSVAQPGSALDWGKMTLTPVFLNNSRQYERSLTDLWGFLWGFVRESRFYLV